MVQVKSTKAYLLESVIINSTRQTKPVDIVNLISDMEIFEHLYKPYLTGQIAFVDSFRLYDRLDIQGAETVTIKIKQTEVSPTIEKTFVIQNIITSRKTNEQTDLIMLHLIEDILFKSKLQNVNKCYRGNPASIITTVADEWLDKEVANLTSDIFQKKIKVVVPNKSPMETMEWMRDRATTANGFPVYLFSSFTTDRLVLADLKFMIDQKPINTRAPMIHGMTEHDMEVGLNHKLVAIKDYSVSEADNMYDLIGRGLVGAKHTFIDTHTGEHKTHKFNVHADAFENVLTANQTEKRNSFSENFKFDDMAIQDYESEVITKITESGAYDDATGRFKSYNEDNEASDHSKKIIADSLRHFLVKSPVSIRIDGAGFIENEAHYTTGNVVRILFNANRPTTDGSLKLDLKKSGDYLIYGAKHAFAGARYQMHLKCAKLTHHTDDTPLRIFN